MCAFDDTTDMCGAYGKLTSQLSVDDAFFTEAANFVYLFVCKFYHAVTFICRLSVFRYLVSHIVGLRPKKQVGRVDAGRIVALVEHKQPFRHFPDKDAITCDVSRNGSAFVPRERTVSKMRSSECLPFPASVVSKSDLRHKSFCANDGAFILTPAACGLSLYEVHSVERFRGAAVTTTEPMGGSVLI